MEEDEEEGRVVQLDHFKIRARKKNSLEVIRGSGTFAKRSRDESSFFFFSFVAKTE